MEEKKKNKLKLNKFRVIVFAIVAVIVIIVSIVAIAKFVQNINTNPETKYVKILEDGTKVNTSKKLAQTKNIDGIEIKDITLKEKNNVTELEATAVNTTDSLKEELKVNIEFLNDKNEVVAKIFGYISKLQPGESTKIRTQTTLDFANSYNISITKI